MVQNAPKISAADKLEGRFVTIYWSPKTEIQNVDSKFKGPRMDTDLPPKTRRAPCRCWAGLGPKPSVNEPRPSAPEIWTGFLVRQL